MPNPENLQVQLSPEQLENLLSAFRNQHDHFAQAVADAIHSNADSTVLERLGDGVDEYAHIVTEYSYIFSEPELQAIQTNIEVMRNDLRLQHRDMLDASHHGRPTLVSFVSSGERGRPSIQIDEQFLRWAYPQRSTASIARFLGVSRTTLRSALLDLGIAEPQQNPFIQAPEDNSENPDTLLDPQMEVPQPSAPQPISFTGQLSSMSDNDLDQLVQWIRSQFRRAGITTIHGSLRSLGFHIPRERIRLSLLRIDPVHRIFDRIRIRRRVYSVPGPNSLWHHDGQHGLIRWGIVIHGFIDGYSRLIVGMHASDNNSAETVLDVFLTAGRVYGIPSRVRGDHGTENLLVAAWMESMHGIGRGSYIWGRSVHNIRIERLWVDITTQVTSTWQDIFRILELHHGLNINNVSHIWLLHHLFLPTLNGQLAFFAESWNQHQIQIRGGPNRSPADMFGFDMLVHGIRGSQMQDEIMTNEELEVFGVDWDALEDDRLLDSRQRNNPTNEGHTTWFGQSGPPEHLNQVMVEPPVGALNRAEITVLDRTLGDQYGGTGDDAIILLWSTALVLARQMHPENF